MNLRGDLRAVRAVMRKDIKVAFTQRLLVGLGIVIPVNFLLLFMLFAINGGQAPTAVVMEDHGPLAQKFLAALEGAHSFQITQLSVGQAQMEMSAGEVVAIITVPPSFDSDLSAGRPVELPVAVNNLQVDFTNDIRRAVPMTVTSFYAAAYPGQVTVRASEVDVQPTDTGYIPYLAVSVAVLGLLLAGILQGAQSAAKEHEAATVIELVLSPAAPWAIVGGKMLAALAVNAVSGVVVLILVVALVGSPPAHPVEVLGFALLLMTAFASLGILVGNLVRRRQAAIPLAIGTSLPLFFVSGPFGPINWLGQLNSVIAHLSPAYYGMAAFQHAFHGYQAAQTSLVEDVVVLFVLAAVCLMAGATTLKPRSA
jgi:ABC-2 type transport system permease protein